MMKHQPTLLSNAVSKPSKPMQIRFDPNQEYQLNAVESVAKIFDGQRMQKTELALSPTGGFASVHNALDLSDEDILRNLNGIQEENSLEKDTELETIEGTIETIEGEQEVRFLNFSVEMETGTGKTYVYIRTALELFRRYGMRKYIIVVPSVAVREGVLKTFEITAQHFRKLFDNVPFRYCGYDSSNLTQIRQFAFSESVEFMVMTIDSFKKAMDDEKKSNVIHRRHDRMGGEKPIHIVQSVRPILILDEPQNMESTLSLEALTRLHPLFALRYSATHRNTYNLAYRLTPYDAYKQGLVKRIEVAGVQQQDDANEPFIRLEEIKSKQSTIVARITVHQLMKGNTVKEKTITLNPRNDCDVPLSEKTHLQQYEPWSLEEIVSNERIRFTNGVELSVGQELGADKDAIFEAQMRYAIETHMLKQQRLQEHGLKILTLFFIDKVDHYVEESGIIRTLFAKCFNELKAKYPEWKDIDPEDIQASYFAQKKKKTGETEYLDSKTGEKKEDKEAYDLIMKDKERLLSFEEPRCFIFSHSALREGWDNPNVFQICTLNQSVSEVKKRQEIGRGVRLPVNQDGERVRDENINVLTVIANESYEDYVRKLQTEVTEEYGESGKAPDPCDARKPVTAKLQKHYLLKSEFKELWEQIKHKTRYSVSIDTEKLVQDVSIELSEAIIKKPRITITKAKVDVHEDEHETAFTALQSSGARTLIDLAGRYALPNLLEAMEHLLEYTTPSVRLTRSTLLRIFSEVGRNESLENPQEFASVAVRIIKQKLADQLINGVKYEKINEWYEMEQFEAEVQGWEQYFVPSPNRGLYDYTHYESDVEKEFVEAMEGREDVKLYVKLPSWFTVQTPIGEYNPDWAIVMKKEGADRLYLVRETKGESFWSNPRLDEKRKTICGERHFVETLGVNYEVVTTADQLP